ncbi:MAG: FAD-binding protein [Alphaproteobacteria bacterium]|nr:FAD-binding protein [Alphaproteobacteria bacterium]
MLPYGNGRSYGDSCLNTGGVLIDCRHLDRFIAFDADSGVLRCEAGVLLADILDVVVPRGWFLPVSPGTRLVTVGGAIANDIHGKNHHRAGTFGSHLRSFELLRSDGARLFCAPQENRDYFHATIGGLGLTGMVTWAELQLKPIANAYIDQEIIRFHNLTEFFRLSEASDDGFEYTVAWIDCLAKDVSLGRGLFMRGNHATEIARGEPKTPRDGLSVPFAPPLSLINQVSLRAFNALYFRKQREDEAAAQVHYRPFFYPLDAIGDWNRMYGPKGFFQYQCVLPLAEGDAGMTEILRKIAAAGMGSFLAVLKIFGDRPSPGLMSFPRPGVTLALDFPNTGDKVRGLLDQLDAITGACGGAVYPAKDARMSPQMFRQAFPRLEEFAKWTDPAFSSSFWRRVNGANSQDNS